MTELKPQKNVDHELEDLLSNPFATAESLTVTQQNEINDLQVFRVEFQEFCRPSLRHKYI